MTVNSSKLTVSKLANVDFSPHFNNSLMKKINNPENKISGKVYQ